jgi:hypothetical protein
VLSKSSLRLDGVGYFSRGGGDDKDTIFLTGRHHSLCFTRACISSAIMQQGDALQRHTGHTVCPTRGLWPRRRITPRASEGQRGRSTKGSACRSIFISVALAILGQNPRHGDCSEKFRSTTFSLTLNTTGQALNVESRPSLLCSLTACYHRSANLFWTYSSWLAAADAVLTHFQGRPSLGCQA